MRAYHVETWHRVYKIISFSAQLSVNMVESSIFQKSWTFEIQIFELAVRQKIINNFI